MRRLILVGATAVALGGCGVAGRLADVGKAPRFSKPTEVPAPLVEKSLGSSGGSDPLMTADRTILSPTIEPASGASLFRPGAAGLFRDGRAYRKGDILTVKVNVADRAAFANSTARSPTGSENASIAALLGLDKLIDRIIPGDSKSSAGVTGGSTSTSSGKGDTARSETINLTIWVCLMLLSRANRRGPGQQRRPRPPDRRPAGTLRPADLRPAFSFLTL